MIVKILWLVKIMSSCNSFAPIYNEQSKVLILGSMPGKRSLAMQQYYAHPQNRFWKMLGEIFQTETGCTYEERKAFLLQHKIALWDVLKYCERESSLDSDIRNETPNDVTELLRENPQIQAIFCNGGKAAASFKKYFSGAFSQLDVYYYHSTSPANARMSLTDLVLEWQIIRKYLD